MRHRKESGRVHGAVSTITMRTPRPASAAGEDQSMEPGVTVPKPPSSTWHQSSDPLVEATLAAIVMGVYLQTLYPSIAGGDSGELVAESCHLGVSHPPGYPLFNMLVYVVTNYLPVYTSKAWNANAFSAGCDALAAVVMYRTLMLWTSSSSSSSSASRSPANRKTAAFAASALFAFSPLIWTYAVGAEVFALNNLFAAALIYTLLQYSIDRSLRLATRGAWLSGLAMCNQHTIILFVLPIVGWVLATRRSLFQAHELARITLAFCMGLLPYLYMPITAILNPQPGSWGDVSTLLGFFHHLRRADYGTFRLFSTTQATEDLWTRLRLYSVDLSSREAPFHMAIPLALVGVYASCSLQFFSTAAPHAHSKQNAVGRLVVGMYVFYMVVFHALANLPLSEGLTYGVHMRFWQQPNIVVFLWIGIGLHTLLESVVSRVRLLKLVARGVVLSLVALQVVRWYAFCDQSEALYIRNYATALLDPLPRDAVLFVNFDLQWTSLRYLQRCEHRRTDVTVLNYSMMTYHWFATKQAQYPRLAFPGSRLVPFGNRDDNGFTFAQFLDANRDLMVAATRGGPGGGIFFGGKLNYNDPDFHAAFTFVPYGLLDEIQPLGAATTGGRPAMASPTLTHWYATQQHVRNQIQLRLPGLPPPDKYDDETWEWTIARDHAMKQLSWSTYLLERTIDEDPHNLTLLAESTHAMEHSFQFEPKQFWSASSNLKNLGLAYAQIVKSNQEFKAATNPANDPFLNSVVGHNVQDPTKYKDRASSRMLEVWDAWLRVPEARNDPGYEAIRGIVRKFVLHDATTHTETTTTSTTQKKTKKTKKPKKKRTTRKTATKQTD